MTRHAFDREIDTSNLDKVLFGDSGITKGDLIDYAERVAELVVAHCGDRPLAVVRYPDGIAEEGFFQKNAGSHFPDWIRREDVPRREGGTMDHVVLDEPATLVYLAQQGAIEWHPWLSRWPDLDTPVEAIFDLDPPAGSDVAQVREATRRLWDLLDELGLDARLKTSGSAGFHLHISLDGTAGFDDLRSACADIASLMAVRHPELATVEQRVEDRQGRVFVDHLRNAYGQTAVAPYGVRALPQAPVAVPLRRDELVGADPQGWTIESVPRRLAQIDDPWSAPPAPVSARDVRRAVDAARQ